MQTNSKKLDKLKTKTRKLEKKLEKKLASAQSNCCKNTGPRDRATRYVSQKLVNCRNK